MFRGFWPGVKDDASASPDNREISRLNDAIDKVVISDSLTVTPEQPWPNTRIVSHDGAHAQIAELKRQPGSDIVVFGSRTMWSGLLASGLVDELHPMIGNVVVGGGTPIFDGQPSVGFTIIDSHQMDGSNNVLVRYSVAPVE